EPEGTLAGAPEAPPASTQATAVLAAEVTAAEENEVPAFGEEELAVLGAQAIEGLREVIDPELGVNIVDLGLVYGIAFGRGEIIVTMTLTTPGCPLHASLQ